MRECAVAPKPGSSSSVLPTWCARLTPLSSPPSAFRRPGYPPGSGLSHPTSPSKSPLRPTGSPSCRPRSPNTSAPGTRLVWIVEPATRTVHVYRAPYELQVFGEEDDLDGGDVLPGLRCPVRRLFA